MWFSSVFGSVEKESNSYSRNRNLFVFDEEKKTLFSKGNSTYFDVGPFEVLSVSQLNEKRARLASFKADISDAGVDGLTFENVIGDVRTLIRDPRNNGSVFQVASQFNCLEMVGPKVTPEAGVTIYSKDPTQGPACAIACPAATVFRNYFVNGTGQYRTQLDLLHKGYYLAVLASCQLY